MSALPGFGSCRGVPVFEIFHEINVIIPGGLIIGFAFVVLFVRGRRKRQGPRDIEVGFWFRLSAAPAAPRHIRTSVSPAIQAQQAHPEELTARGAEPF